MQKVLIATLYSADPVLLAANRLGADKLVLLIDKEPSEEQQKSLKLPLLPRVQLPPLAQKQKSSPQLKPPLLRPPLLRPLPQKARIKNNRHA